MYYEKATLENHPGVIVLSLGSATPKNVNKVCRKFLRIVGEDFCKESLIQITDTKITKVKHGEVVFEKLY